MIRLEKSWQTKAVDAGEVRDVDEKERTVLSVITTDRVDSDKEIVLPGGLNLKRHDKNPVVLFMHDPKAVIGKALWKKLSSDKREMRAKTRFAETDLAEEVWQLVKGGFIRSYSIGMDPSSAQIRDVTEKDIRNRPEWTGGRAIILKADLFEYSVATIPANEDAMNRMYDSGLINHTKQYLPCGAVVTPEDEGDDPPIVVRVDMPVVRVVQPVKITSPLVSVRRYTADEAKVYVDERLRHIRGLT